MITHQGVRVEQLLHRIPETTPSEGLIIGTMRVAKKVGHNASFHEHLRAVVDNPGREPRSAEKL